ncbi:hypothetical protein JW872_01775 [Candidatus Babeliales bacterium]|nr:hypothetical protein [Candidatus Babeliales bacterium]
MQISRYLLMLCPVLMNVSLYAPPTEAAKSERRLDKEISREIRNREQRLREKNKEIEEQQRQQIEKLVDFERWRREAEELAKRSTLTNTERTRMDELNGSIAQYNQRQLAIDELVNDTNQLRSECDALYQERDILRQPNAQEAYAAHSDLPIQRAKELVNSFLEQVGNAVSSLTLFVTETAPIYVQSTIRFISYNLTGKAEKIRHFIVEKQLDFFTQNRIAIRSVFAYHGRLDTFNELEQSPGQLMEAFHGLFQENRTVQGFDESDAQKYDEFIAKEIQPLHDKLKENRSLTSTIENAYKTLRHQEQIIEQEAAAPPPERKINTLKLQTAQRVAQQMLENRNGPYARSVAFLYDRLPQEIVSLIAEEYVKISPEHEPYVDPDGATLVAIWTIDSYLRAGGEIPPLERNANDQKRLNLSGLHLTSLEGLAEALRVRAYDLNDIAELKLNDNPLEDLPIEVLELFPRLSTLYIRQTKIKEIPVEFFQERSEPFVLDVSGSTLSRENINALRSLDDVTVWNLRR